MLNSEQEIFDKVAVHLLTQKKKAVDDGNAGFCMYRAPDGGKCAVGCLIPDEDYRTSMEGESVAYLSDHFESCAWMYKYLDLLCKLQGLHDNFTPSEWPLALREIATDFKLTSSVMDGMMTNAG